MSEVIKGEGARMSHGAVRPLAEQGEDHRKPGRCWQVH
jgi:hypothetical protein